MRHTLSINFITLLILLISVNLLSCTSKADENDIIIQTYPNSHLLVDATWLADHLDSGELVIVDMRADNFEDGHIPGAINIAGAGALSDPDHPIEFFLVGPEKFAKLMTEKGIGNDSDIIIYDDGNSLHAARLFYALEYYGHDQTRILNGGFSSWKDGGFAVSTETQTIQNEPFVVNVNEDLVCDARYIRDKIEDPNSIVFDARSVEEFTGEDKRGINAGHIPGAVNIEWSNFVYFDSEIPYFRTPVEIKNLLENVGITPDKEVIPHCHTNVRGSHAYFTLRLMGYDSVRPYEGSWSEYGNIEGAPVSQ